MIEKKIVLRYCKALLYIAIREKTVDQVEKELVRVEMILRENTQLKEFLLHPRIPRSQKRRLIEEVFKPLISQLVFHFFCHIVEKKREEILMVIADEFKEAADEFRGVIKAKVQTAGETPDQKLKRLKQYLERLLGKRVELEVEVIPEILGGVIVQIGSQITDGSIRGRLERIRSQLLELKVA